ncbi:MAG: hypothetical protein HY753_02085 [Nitrospirae bacterium]|nr:hypothetical protein [Nitrospirota bacterium]
MKTTIDMDKVIAKWKKDIEFHQSKIREIQNKMDIGKEIISISIQPETVLEVQSSMMRETLSRTPATALPGMIIKILEDRHDWLSTAEVYDALKKSGFKSESKKLRLLVATTINKMGNKGRVARKKQGHNVLYASADFGSSGDNMFTQK